MKRAHICFIILLSCFGLTAWSQDRLVMNDGTELTVKVLEIKTGVVTYKKSTNPSGPTYEALKSQVHKIVFQNGDEEIITPENNDGKTGLSFRFIGGDTVLVTHVAPGSPGEQAGVLAGDRLIRIGTAYVGQFSSGQKVQDLLDGRPGTTVEITLVRWSIKGTVTLMVERRIPDWNTPVVKREDAIIITNDNASGSAPESSASSGNTSRRNDGDDVGGVYVSIMPGIGGASFREPLLGVFEMEIGDCLPRINTSFGAKLTLFHLPETDDVLFSIKYTTTGYFGKYTKQGFFVGGDIGIAFYPDGDQPLWDLAVTTGYSFRLIRNMRLELVGSLNLLPTISFSNVAIGGFGGVRLSGIW